MNFPKLASFKTVDDFRRRLTDLGLDLPVAEPGACPHLGTSLPSGPGHSRTLGNRFAILPMEGWDATADGQPTDLVRRRWQRFGQSGAMRHPSAPFGNCSSLSIPGIRPPTI